MHHVPKDKRALDSADRIWTGMERCLQETALDKLHITEICQQAGVGRATFYRLFDSPQDVLAYRCDHIFESLANEMSRHRFHSLKETFLFFIEVWLRQETLIDVLAANNLTSLIYDTHMKYQDLTKTLYIRNADLDSDTIDYLVAILTAVIPTVAGTWYKHGRKDSPSDVLASVSTSIAVIDHALNP